MSEEEKSEIFIDSCMMDGLQLVQWFGKELLIYYYYYFGTGMFSALSRASGHLGIKVRTILNSPGYAEFKISPRFNICFFRISQI